MAPQSISSTIEVDDSRIRYELVLLLGRSGPAEAQAYEVPGNLLQKQRHLSDRELVVIVARTPLKLNANGRPPAMPVPLTREDWGEEGVCPSMYSRTHDDCTPRTEGEG
eukprot:scaffold142_cov315-Prasinococcus_capsulatus_cf.AAC.3